MLLTAPPPQAASRPNIVNVPANRRLLIFAPNSAEIEQPSMCNAATKRRGPDEFLIFQVLTKTHSRSSTDEGNCFPMRKEHAFLSPRAKAVFQSQKRAPEHQIRIPRSVFRVPKVESAHCVSLRRTWAHPMWCCHTRRSGALRMCFPKMSRLDGSLSYRRSHASRHDALVSGPRRRRDYGYVCVKLKGLCSCAAAWGAVP